MNNNLKFNTWVVGVNGYELHLENIKFIKNIDVTYFLKNYKISNIWRGKWIIKRLINRIFKRRIHQVIQWDKTLWDRIQVTLIEAGIQENKYSDIDIVEKNIKDKVKLNRFDDIKKYQLLLTKGVQLPPPLYISGRCINYLGGNVDDNLLFILDGARRITAHILNKCNPKILILDLKDNDNKK